MVQRGVWGGAMALTSQIVSRRICRENAPIAQPIGDLNAEIDEGDRTQAGHILDATTRQGRRPDRQGDASRPNHILR